MSRNIVMCLDGTGCKLRENNTNVIKLYRILKREKDRQVLFYNPGVGTLGDPNYKTPFGKKITQILGLGFGRGIMQNVINAYTFLMENYKEGDKIFIFGFSRGAYTARAVAAFISACGLLESGCENLIPYAVELFRDAKSYQQDEEKFWTLLEAFRLTYCRTVDAHFLGLWDPVKSFGWAYDPITLPLARESFIATHIRHALAIDEFRTFFYPMACDWDIEEVGATTEQVWFAGCHGDIGGGFEEHESGLAKIALEWMVKEAEACGLLIDHEQYNSYVLGGESEETDEEFVGPNPSGEIHNSLQGAWKLLQYAPKKMWSIEEREAKLVLNPPKIRAIKPQSKIHISVLERLQDPTCHYRPKNLGLETDEPNKIREALEKKYSLVTTKGDV